jgi:hypothetical protein
MLGTFLRLYDIRICLWRFSGLESLTYTKNHIYIRYVTKGPNSYHCEHSDTGLSQWCRRFLLLWLKALCVIAVAASLAYWERSVYDTHRNKTITDCRLLQIKRARLFPLKDIVLQKITFTLPPVFRYRRMYFHRYVHRIANWKCNVVVYMFLISFGSVRKIEKSYY